MDCEESSGAVNEASQCRTVAAELHRLAMRRCSVNNEDAIVGLLTEIRDNQREKIA